MIPVARRCQTSRRRCPTPSDLLEEAAKRRRPRRSWANDACKRSNSASSLVRAVRCRWRLRSLASFQLNHGRRSRVRVGLTAPASVALISPWKGLDVSDFVRCRDSVAMTGLADMARPRWRASATQCAEFMLALRGIKRAAGTSNVAN